jgi:hypothetical protein
MPPVVTLSWCLESGEPIVQHMSRADDDATSWVFDGRVKACQNTEESEPLPCFVDVFLDVREFGSTAAVSRVELVSNARHMEVYSEEVKKNMDGGDLAPAFEYCETSRGTSADDLDGTKVNNPMEGKIVLLSALIGVVFIRRNVLSFLIRCRVVLQHCRTRSTSSHPPAIEFDSS